MKLIAFLAVPLLLGATITYSPSSDGGVSPSAHPATAAVTCATTTCPATDLQTAIDAAWLGDTITLQYGVTWTTTGITIHAHSSGAGTLLIRSSAPDAALPAAGQRITPLYIPLMPVLQLQPGGTGVIQIEQTANVVKNITFLAVAMTTTPGFNFSGGRMLSFWVPPSSSGLATVTGVTVGSPVTLSMASTTGFHVGDHVMVTCTQTDAQGACGVTGVSGWWVLANVTPTSVDLIGTTGAGSYVGAGTLLMMSDVQWDPTTTPDNITMDRCIVMPDPVSQVRNGFTIGGRTFTVRDSYFDHLKSYQDAQAVSMPNAVGPVVVTNNYLSASGENVITGGTEPNVPDNHAHNVTVSHNTLFKDPALFLWETWKANTFVRAGKVIVDATVSPTISWVASQSGTTGANQPTMPTLACTSPPVCSGGCCVADGTATWQVNFLGSAPSDHWTVKNNFEIKSADGITVRYNLLDGNWGDGQDGRTTIMNATKQTNVGTPLLRNLEFGNNVMRNVVQGPGAQCSQDYGDGTCSSVSLHDNLLYSVAPSNYASEVFTFGVVGSRPPYFEGLRITHNTFRKGAGQPKAYLVGNIDSPQYDAPVVQDNIWEIDGMPFPISGGFGGGTYFGANVWSHWSVGGMTVDHNIFSGEDLSGYPAGNFNPSFNSVGFTDVAHGNFTLLSGSPYHNAASDGTDVGADTTLLPQIKSLSVSALGPTATLAWSVNSITASTPCSVEASTSQDYPVAYISDLDPTKSNRPDATGTGTSRSIVLGSRVGLTPFVPYYYRIHCGGSLEQGNFTSTPNQTYLQGATVMSGAIVQ